MSRQAIELHRQAIQQGLDGLRSLLQNDLSLDEALEIAFILWDASETSQESLGPIKDRLRDEVADQPPGVVKVAGASGRLSTVTVPQPKYVLRKGADLRSISHLLDEVQMDTLFPTKTTTTPNRKAIEAFLASASDDQKRAVLKLLNQQESTARISFRKGR